PSASTASTGSGRVPSRSRPSPRSTSRSAGAIASASRSSRDAVDRWVDVAGLRVHYLESGQGPPLVLLHGGAVDAAGFSFHATIPALADRFRVLAPDWPGYGESASPPAPWGLADHVGFVEHFLDATGVARASLVGLSLGGGAALGLALDHPAR